MSRIAVVGGGVVGLCTGIALRRRGVEVVLLDDPSGPPGASAWNCGWLAPSHCHPLPGPAALRRSARWLLSREPAPLSIRPEPRLARWLLGFAWSSRARPHAAGLAALAELMREALPAWRRMEHEGLDIDWLTERPLVPFLDRARLEAEVRGLDEVAALGLAEPTVLDHDAARERVPSFSGDVVGAIELAGEPGVDPAAVMAALRTRFDALGGKRIDEPALDVHRENGRGLGVVTRSGTQRVNGLLLAAGAWSGAVARRLGVRLPVTSGRGYAIDLEPAPGHPGRVLQLLEASMAVSPLGDRLRLCGTMELARPTAPLDQRRLDLMMRAPGRYFDGWQVPVKPLRIMAAPRPMTPDGLPIIGPLRGSPGVVVATGHGMLGMTLGAITGELVADLVVEGAASLPRAFSPSRFRW